jgi:hypothetical protein
MTRPGLRAVVLGLALLVATEAPAGADPPRPTDYSSTVTGVDPAVEGVEAEVVGGDSFLRLRVEPDVEVVVAGYQGEPYLRFLPDGNVEENANSPAAYLNADRYANVELPDRASPEADPAWRQVGDGGEYAWHDHRIHWMSPARPSGVEPGDTVQPWTVPLTVDGRTVEVSGTLVLEPSVSPLPWIAVALAAAVATYLAGRRHAPLVAGLASVAAAVIAVVVGGAEQIAVPAAAGRNLPAVVLPVLALVCAVAGVLLRDKPAGGALTFAGLAAVLAWAGLRIAGFWKPVLPTDLPPNLDRAGTAAAIGLAVGAGALVLRARRAAVSSRRPPE